ncbi:ABC transporter ATP-binding protein [Microvirga lotononidis]|uniref:Spermidine/putrescine import ATP-binding protein PotA n=1 Tax=Microvirga lotononidis TaxID=864069 RepID=I4YQV9_9HYPH|nr:ABC transporter ATP-binding protein [Microvirga lotononidis]EIM26351.1 spermidine/putrescine ABC transporter ATP-binding subunit [Microvirga lotononidis]WQO30719.1 ABC transporter ATP-binding protein [Microvirga lotononidis]
MMHQTIRSGSPTVSGRDVHLRLDGLSKRYGDSVAVASLDLAVPKGELVALLGPSGCGKTTTLRMVAGLIKPTDGRIVVGGHDITVMPPYRRDMGLVFQSYALFPHMSVAKNVAFGLEMRSVPKAEIEQRVKQALAMVRLEALAERKPRELSGGQQQRVALARALVIRPSILLLDEPLSNLDAKLRDEMRNEIRDIQQNLGITAVFVTHDQVEALSMCDKVVVMRGGKLEQVGTPVDVYEHPTTPFVASFVGRTNRLEGTAQGDGRVSIGSSEIRVPGRPGGRVEIMVRPHRMRLVETGSGQDAAEGVNRVAGRLSRVTFIGDLLQYHVDVNGAEIVVEVASDHGRGFRTVGTPVAVLWRIEDTMVFGRCA